MPGMRREARQGAVEVTPEPLTDERLAELERLCAEATPGPWRTSRGDMESYALDESGEWGHVVYIYRPDGHRIPLFGERAREDARFIVAARAALPALIAELRALRRVAEAAEAVVRAQDERWRIGLKGEAERNGAIERLRSMLAEWRRCL